MTITDSFINFRKHHRSTIMEIEQLKLPIGTYIAPEEISFLQIEKWITTIECFPRSLIDLVGELTKEELNWKYRPEGWTIKQVVHHCADSHINSLMRFKLALTEDLPSIRVYHEERWAELTDSQSDDIQDSLTLLKGLHGKWVYLLRSLCEEELEREYIHPQHHKILSIKETIGNYAWHCEHHLAHIKQAIDHQGIF